MRRFLALGAVVALALLTPAWVPSAHGFSIEDPSGEVDDDDKYSLIPAQEEIEVVPGEITRIQGRIFNHTGDELTITLKTADLEASSDPGAFVVAVEDAAYGAGSWVSVQDPTVTLQHGQTGVFDIDILPPADAPTGSSYAAILAVPEVPDDPTEAEAASRTKAVGVAVGQLLLTVPGELVRDGAIKEVDVSETLIFQDQSFARYEVTYRNTGNVTAHVGGVIEITSLFGNVVKRFEFEPLLVLRDSERTVRFVWTDPPPLGRFVARAYLEADNVEKEAEAPALWVLPPWWWFVIGAVVVLVPIALWIRNRRSLDWQQYMDDDEWNDDDEGLPTY